MESSERTVYVVDDDAVLCEALQALLEAEGLRVETHTSAESFLAARCGHEAGCLVLDVRMRGMSGLELQEHLVQLGATLPVIVLTGHGDVPMAVRAVKAGVVDFLEKPVNDQLLLERIRNALALDAQRRAQRVRRAEAQRRLDSLTAREYEVMERVVAGLANKQIAGELGITEKTVEAHRKHVMDKLAVGGVAELVVLVLQCRGQEMPS
jgi:two-component system response regulator FixJ